MAETEVSVSLSTVASRKLAAVRREVTIGAVANAWRPALDKVWAFLKEHPDLRDGGHNVFLYHHGQSRSAPMAVDFGVEVSSAFDPTHEVFATETPAGEVAMAVHVGSYASLRATHAAVHQWCTNQRRSIAGKSWEIYGDWTDDESKLETTIAYLLK